MNPALVVILLAACSEPPAPDTLATPGAVVFAVDATRADHASLFGVSASKCRVYTQAWSAAPWTTSGTYALLTGRLPTGSFRRPPEERPGPIDAIWADEVLSDHPVVRTLVGLPALDKVPTWSGSPDLFQEVTAWLGDGANRDRALYVHAVGAHDPWDGFGRRGNWSMAMRHIIDAREVGVELDSDHAAWGRVQYTQGVTDAATYLRPAMSRALGSGRLVIVTADHGEALGEDGRWLHGTSLHDVQVRVPLLVCGPGVDPGIDDTPVGPLCVAETVRGSGPCDLRTGAGLRVSPIGMLDNLGEHLTFVMPRSWPRFWVTRTPDTPWPPPQSAAPE